MTGGDALRDPAKAFVKGCLLVFCVVLPAFLGWARLTRGPHPGGMIVKKEARHTSAWVQFIPIKAGSVVVMNPVHHPTRDWWEITTWRSDESGEDD